jgi:hypothetical protein
MSRLLALTITPDGHSGQLPAAVVSMNSVIFNRRATPIRLRATFTCGGSVEAPALRKRAGRCRRSPGTWTGTGTVRGTCRASRSRAAGKGRIGSAGRDVTVVKGQLAGPQVVADQ